MYLNINTKEVQSNLADYCRTGETRALPGTDPQRLKHYRRLVFNIINDSLQSAYPLTYQLLKDDSWDELVDEFFTNHPCQSPQVWWMPKEFYEYLVEQDHAIITQYPFLPNLLEMEWLEVELFMMEDIRADYHRSGQLSNDALVLNPEHRLVRFDFPVHLKNASQLNPEDKSDFFLLMHREPSSGKVQFTEVSVFFARMIEILGSRAVSVTELIALTCSDFNLQVSKHITGEVTQFIEKAINNQLILGFTN
ncbi:MAG: putative DNA-binding domain-containing protein [Bacteroidales bacterium]|nr:putative DNA-binding domain-containing protein [Bacteroidales bacterium]